MCLVKIDKSKKYYLIQDGEVLLGPCDHLQMEAENVYFSKVGEEQMLYHTKSKKELDLTGLFPSFRHDFMWVVVDDEFRFYGCDNFEELGQIAVINNDPYNITRNGRFTVYQQSLYVDWEEVLDLSRFEDFVITPIEGQKMFSRDGMHFIMHGQGPQSPSYLLAVEAKVPLDEIQSVSRLCGFIHVKTDSKDYIHHNDGRLFLETDEPMEHVVSEHYWLQSRGRTHLLTQHYGHGNRWPTGVLLEVSDVDDASQLQIVYKSNDTLAFVGDGKAVLVEKKKGKVDVEEVPVSTSVLIDSVRKFGEVFQLVSVNDDVHIFNPDTMKLVVLGRDFMAPRIVGGQIVYCGFDGKSVQVDAEAEEVMDYSFLEEELLVVVLVNGEYRLISSVAGIVKKSKKPMEFRRHWGRFVHMNPERGRSLDVRWYDSETRKLKALPMKFSSTEDTDMEARLKLSSNAGYTYSTLSFGPEDCPLIQG